MRFRNAVLCLAIAAAGTQAMAQERYWQCAAFAREFSGLSIRANALDWWDKADGLYQRGYSPRVGAVMAFIPYGNMRLGHVATVTGISGPRDITVTHANWSLIDGTRGQIEHDVAVRDVSDANDWSRVRVWYAPIGDLGSTAWPIRGFIYPDRIDGIDPGDRGLPARSRPRRAPIELVPAVFYADAGRDAPSQIAPLAQPSRRRLLGDDVIRLAMLEARSSPPRQGSR